MTMTIRVISCVFALIAAIALFLFGLFIQAGADAASGSPVVLFGLCVALFGVANYYGVLIHDDYVESRKPRQHAGKR